LNFKKRLTFAEDWKRRGLFVSKTGRGSDDDDKYITAVKRVHCPND
jgi:hypothetical protein